MANSPHAALDCVTCHNPHQSAIYDVEDYSPTLSIRRECGNCHLDEELYQASPTMAGLDCVACHMPLLSKSAVGDLANFVGDVASHSWSISPFADSEQFYEVGDSTFTNPWLTLDYACRNCHADEGEDFRRASSRSDAELEDVAIDYHARPVGD